MLHNSELGEHAHRFPADQDGNVPEHGDQWQAMNFEHGELNPNEPGISAEEKARRLAYLDETWWPSVIAKVNQEKAALAQLPSGSPIKRWREEVLKPPTLADGYEVD